VTEAGEDKKAVQLAVHNRSSQAVEVNVFIYVF
jgi:hypothetical protein